jgi:hypothetical protein
MRNLGKVKPGSTLYIPFDTFDGGTGASITLTGLATTDIEIFKDGAVTTRASDSGYTVSADFNSRTGLHVIAIDLADNGDANFFEAGSHYMVAVDAVTVDGQTVRFWLAEFRIGYEGALLDTTIATLATQISFTLEDGSADNDAYNGCPIIVHNLASTVQLCIGYVSDYVGASKTISLDKDPAVFTMAVGDNVSILPRVHVGAVTGDILDPAGDGSATPHSSA